MRILTPFLAFFLGSQPVAAADLYFCWVGGSGYSMTGSMTVPDNMTHRQLITERDLLGFEINGFHNGKFLGSWDLSQLSTGDTWHLRFDPQTMTFPTGGNFTTSNSQGWNANGGVRDCGSPGFGFNSGGYAQDICLDGTFLIESSVAPNTPLVAGTVPLGPSCETRLPISKR